jgi:hypothetical protein
MNKMIITLIPACLVSFIKNAKIWPRGISFTSNQSALVYLVDLAGARSTTDTFHDLYSIDIAQGSLLSPVLKTKL